MYLASFSLYLLLRPHIVSSIRWVSFGRGSITGKIKDKIRGMFEMNCLLSSSSISTWGTIKTNTYLYRAIQYLHNGI